MVKKEWIPMFKNNDYFVNPYTGEIKNKYSKVLKGRILLKNNIPKCVYYTINGKSKKGHRIVAEAVLKRDLHGLPIGHKNNLNIDNRYSNLLIGKRKNNAKKIEIQEYKKGVETCVYSSVREFEKETGISHHCFKNNIYKLGCYKWKKLKNEL